MKNILVIEPGFQVHKEPILKMMAQVKGTNLYFGSGLSKTVNSDWAKIYCKDWYYFDYSNLKNQTLSFLEKRRIKLDGIITWVDTSVHHVNELQHILGLPVQSLLRGKEFRNKFNVRKVLAEAGVDDTYFKLIKTESDIDAIPNSKFPLIMKPTEMMASLGVHIVSSREKAKSLLPKVLEVDFIEEDLRSLYGDIAQEALLEEIHIGQGFSVETVVQKGEVHILGLNKKFTSGLYDMGNCFAPRGIAFKVRDAIYDLIYRSHAALKYQNCVTHTELRVVRGIPKIIEINSRLGGDYIPLMIHKNNGFNLGKILVDTYTGATTRFGTKKFSPVYASYYVTDTSGTFRKASRANSKITWYYANDDKIIVIGNAPVYLGHKLSKRTLKAPVPLKGAAKILRKIVS